MDVAVLYHFTARQLLPKVQAQGISKCGVPWTVNEDFVVRMMHGLQWLTINPDFDEQSWAYPALFDPHRMRKTDARISVGIPKLAEFKLVPWSTLLAQPLPITICNCLHYPKLLV